MKFLSTIFIALVLAAEFIAPLFCEAQGTLYVSNLGQTPTGSASIGSDAWIAQGFVSGSNPGGYLLNSIQLLMNSASGSPSGFTVSIYSLAHGIPGTNLGSLDGSDPSTGGVFTYTAANITLSPSAYYFVVVNGTTPIASGAYSWSAADTITQDNGFTIDGSYFSSTDGSGWTFHNRQNVFQLGIYATAIPEPSASWLLLLGGGVSIFVRTHKRHAATITRNSI